MSARLRTALSEIKRAALDSRHWRNGEAVSISRIRILNICDEALGDLDGSSSVPHSVGAAEHQSAAPSSPSAAVSLPGDEQP